MAQGLVRLSRDAVLVFSSDILGLHVVEGILGAGSWLPVLVGVDEHIDECVKLVLTQLPDYASFSIATAAFFSQKAISNVFH